MKNFLKSSPKHVDKNSYKPVSPFHLFYQLTYMSAMAASGISRSKTFEIAALSTSPAAVYFDAINTLVNEFRYDYPDACRMIGLKAKSENMQTFLLRFSDALRSGEQLSDFLPREAGVQGEDYQNQYERDLESMKQWTNAFSSIIISVALIIIIQIVSSMIYSINVPLMTMSVASGLMMAGFGVYIIFRAAPAETMTLASSSGAPEMRRAFAIFRVGVPVAFASALVLNALTGSMGLTLIWTALCLLPIGIASLISDRKLVRKDREFSTFLRSSGGMASASSTTLKQALTKIDLGSFPTLEPDIRRLSARLGALVEPQLCWHRFGEETGSKLISEVTDIFYSGVKMGGDPERVGYLCSLFALKTSQLRAKRRLTASTFSALTSVMQTVVAALMVFIYSIVNNFALAIEQLVPQDGSAAQSATLSLGMAQYSQGDLSFLYNMTVIMVLMLALAGATAIILSDGGYRLKGFFYLSIMLFISGLCFIVVPGAVANILKV